MNLFKKAVIAASASALSAIGLLAVSPPASATGSVECDPGTVNHQNYAVCLLLDAGSPSNSKWTYGSIYISADDNLYYVRFACGGNGTPFTVHVSFTDSSGTTINDSSSGTCGGIPE